jgi:hypothetical protein
MGNGSQSSLRIFTLKGQCHEIFCFGFTTSFASVVDTGGKFAIGVNDTGGKFAAGVNNTGGKLPPVSMTVAENTGDNIRLRRP